MSSKLMLINMTLLVLGLSFAEGLPQRVSSMSIDEAQDILIGNTQTPIKQDCVCMNWRRCADINSDVKCHPDFVYVCCRKVLY